MITEMIAIDKMNHHESDQFPWFFNDDEECAKARSISTDSPQLVLYDGKAKPFVLPLPEDQPSFNQLAALHWVNVAVTENTNKWSYRALGAVSMHNGYIIAYAPTP